MRITTPVEGQIYRLALAELGAEGLASLVAECLARPVQRRAVDTLGYLRLEWLGAEALEAVREGQQRAAKARWGSDQGKVSIGLGDKARLCYALLQAVPIAALPVEFIELRLVLDVAL
ncbi:hypothetical protein [Pseudomonas sp. BF-R-01]|uniref:hypothetical protein n=1 Tax=Pseudomonas sp. BF-R-01 TaxID=2832365 RepID=UPI001CC1BDEB|nr:hypothetical protein [Pseudomonas sp. BF-R-01]